MPQQIRRAVDRFLTQEQTIHRVVELSLRSKVSMPTDGDNMEEWKQQGFPEDLSDAICQRVHGEPSRRLHRMTLSRAWCEVVEAYAMMRFSIQAIWAQAIWGRLVMYDFPDTVENIDHKLHIEERRSIWPCSTSSLLLLQGSLTGWIMLD